MARKIVMRDDIIDENYSDPLGVADDLRRIALPIGGTRTLVISDSKLEGQRLIGEAPLFEIDQPGFPILAMPCGSHWHALRGNGNHLPFIALRFARARALAKGVRIVIPVGWCEPTRPLERKLPGLGGLPLPASELAHFSPEMQQLSQFLRARADAMLALASHPYQTSQTGFWTIDEPLMLPQFKASLRQWLARRRCLYTHSNHYCDPAGVKLVHDTFLAHDPSLIDELL